MIPNLRAGRQTAGTLVLAGSVAAGQAIMLLAAPLLTRIYDPDAFGALAAFVAIVSVLVAVASLRYEMAIPIAVDAVVAARLAGLSLVLVVIAGVLTAILWYFLGGWISIALGIPVLASMGWAIPIAIVAGGSYQALMLWHVRERGYRAIAATRVTQAVAATSTQLGLGLLGVGSVGLVAGDVLGRTAGVGTLMRAADSALRTAGVSIRSLVSTATSHRGFAGWMATAALLSAAAFHAPFLLMPASFGVGAAGTYFLAQRILAVPVALIGSSAGQVFFGEAAQVREDGERLRGLATQLAVVLLAVGWPIYGGLLVAGGPVFGVVFGPEWTEAGTFAQYLAPSFLLWSIASPLSSMLVVGRREAESVAFTGVELVARIGAISVGAAAGSAHLAVVLLAVAGLVLNLAAIWRFLRPAAVRPSAVLIPAVRIAAINMPGLALLAVLASGPPTWWIVMLYAAVVLVGISAAAALLSPVRRVMWRPA